jgi:heme/copper-type cytochrome/quinol oxidase subunit 3
MSAIAGTPSSPRSLDVSGLPTHAFGHRAPLWWGLLLMVAIESTTMALLLVSYLYLRGNEDAWQPITLGRPVLALALAQMALLAASALPMTRSVRAARAGRLSGTRRHLLVATALGAAMLVLRAVEIPLLPFRWDTDARGSVFWMTFGLHTSHVLTGVLENAMMLALLYRGPVEEKHFGDVEASALLWYLCVLEWVPGLALLYFDPLLWWWR